MRIIDADALIAQIESYIERKAITEKDAKIFELICGLIDKAPTVNAIPNEEGYEMYGKGYLQGYERGKNERPQGEWIPVSEKLPEKEGFYLVFLENEQMVVAHSSGIIANHDFEPKMLAWQPLPEPYKKGGAE